MKSISFLKNITQKSTILLLCCLFVFTACEKENLEFSKNNNAVSSAKIASSNNVTESSSDDMYFATGELEKLDCGFVLHLSSGITVYPEFFLNTHFVPVAGQRIQVKYEFAGCGVHECMQEGICNIWVRNVRVFPFIKRTTHASIF